MGVMNREALDLMVMAHHSLSDFTPKTPCPGSTSRKMKSMLRAYVVQAITRAKSMAMELLNRKSTVATNYATKSRRKKNKKLLGSIRTRFSWSSSHVTPIPGFDVGHAYYDSMWNSMIPTEEEEEEEDVESPLSEHLHWLEDKNYSEASVVGVDHGSGEIDRLAEKFIASCHEKFRLEKQESYRRYQEMLARSM